MTQPDLFPEGNEDLDKDRFAIGRAYVLHLPLGARRKGYVYYRGDLLKQVDLCDKGQRQLLVIELMQQGVNCNVTRNERNSVTSYSRRDSLTCRRLSGTPRSLEHCETVRPRGMIGYIL